MPTAVVTLAEVGGIILYSVNGAPWKNADLPTGYTTAQSVYYSNNKFVSVGTGDSDIVWSDDGITHGLMPQITTILAVEEE